MTGPTNKNYSTPYVIIAIIAIILYAGPMGGFIGTIVGISKAFSTLSETGEADPSALAEDISIAFLTTLWGLILCCVGFTLILILHFKLGYRSQWFYWSALIISGFLLLLFPIGTIIGGTTFYILYRKRATYLRS